MNHQEETFLVWLRTLGQVTLGESLAPHTTFKIGGQAEVFFRPFSLETLACFWKNRPEGTPIVLMGGGSNILVRDGGVKGIVIQLGRGCDHVHTLGGAMYAEAGASTGKVARQARSFGLSGVEFLCGIPGSIGGALVMNAGCYGQEMKDVLTAVDALDPQGRKHTLPAEVFAFSYRKSILPQGWLFLAAHLRLTPTPESQIKERMRAINHKRAETQPLKWPNAGSLFKNPPGHKAWELIASAGCRGLQKGGAQVSEKHSNFFINTGDATAAEVEDLALEVQERVWQHHGIRLKWEVRLLGDRAHAF